MFPWYGCHAHVVQIANGDPLVDLTGQEEHILAVVEHVDIQILEDLGGDQLGAILRKLCHETTVHDESRAIPLIATMQVESS